MALPKAVEIQGELADRLMVNRQTPPQGDTGQPDGQQQNVSQPTQPQQQPPQQQAPPAAGNKDSQQTWEQRYRTLQGIHQTDRQRLQTEIAQRDDQIRALTERLDALESQQSASQQQATVQAVEEMDWKELGLSDQQVDELGEDLLSVLRTMAVNIAAKQTAQSLGEVQQQVRRLTESTAKDRDADFNKAVFDAVPDFDAINHDPGFHQWLRESEGFSSRTRHENLREAYERRDAVAVINYFNGYKEASGGAGNVTPQSYGAPPPDTSGAEGPQPWTRAEIQAFYNDVAKGRFRDRQDEAARIEQSIIAARNAGRVTG